MDIYGVAMQLCAIDNMWYVDHTYARSYIWTDA